MKALVLVLVLASGVTPGAQQAAHGPASVSELEAAIKRDPGSSRLHVALGLAYWERNDYTRALKTFQRAVKLGPRSAAAHNWLGVALSETADFAGIPVRLVDTAGLRETGETIERLGIERSYQAMADADLTLVVLDLSRPRTPEDEALLARAREQGRYLVAANKSDLPALWPAGDAIPVSARSGAGVDPLRQRAIEVLAPAAGLAPDDGLITSSRQFNHLRKSLEAIEKTRLAVAAAVPHEFILVDLYDVLQPLDSLTGTTTADDILNRIFSTFCIGK